MLGLFFMFEPAANELIYLRSDILNGNLWGLLSSHFTHCDLEHLFWNLTVFMVLGVYIERKSRVLLISSLAVGIISVDMWLLADSTIEYYCGLSGALNSLFVIAIYLVWKETKSYLIFFIALGYILKLSIELITANSLITDIAWPPVPIAHIVGGFAGVLLLIFCEGQKSLVGKF